MEPGSRDRQRLGRAVRLGESSRRLEKGLGGRTRDWERWC